jgi:hypothetical protein
MTTHIPLRGDIMTTHHLYHADRYLLYLDGGATVLEDFEGGGVKAGVTTEETGSENDPPMKNISSLFFEPMVARTGISMGKSLYGWIKGTIDKANMRKDGCVVSVNGDRRAAAFRHFHKALLTAITLPTLDVNSKDSAFFVIEFEPEKITYKDGDALNLSDAIDTMQKDWLCSGFRLRLGDLPCTHVSKIDSFTIRQIVKPEVKGDFRVSTRMLTKLEIPHLKITFSPAIIKPWAAWFNEFVVKGRNSQTDELSGTIEFLDSCGKEVLGSIDLSHVGIFALSEEKARGEGNNKISHYVAKLYVEKMALNIVP